MKKIFYLLIIITSPYFLNAYPKHFKNFLQPRIPVYSWHKTFNSKYKPLASWSFYEVQQLLGNKQEAQEAFKKALLDYEDTQSPLDKPCPNTQNLWSRVLSQFSIQDWNTLLLAREERHVLTTINPNLPGFMATVNVHGFAEHHAETQKNLWDTHVTAKEQYKAKPLQLKTQTFYKKRLKVLGYPEIPAAIYVWKYPMPSPACSIYPHIYVTPTFFKLSLASRLGILAHEDQHRDNYHMYKEIILGSFLRTQNVPENFKQFSEKEADLKASAHNLHIAFGLLQYLDERKRKDNEITITIEQGQARRTHPSYFERTYYIQELINKLQCEQAGYAWNPFYKTLGLAEWFKRNIVQHNLSI